MHDTGDIVCALDQIVVLGAGPGDAGGIRLLEGVVADQMGWHLAGKADDRDRIHQRVGQAGNRIGRTGPRGDEDDADLAGRARVTFRRVHGPAFLPHQEMAQLVLLEDFVIDRQHGSARIAENRIDALVDQGADDQGGATHALFSHTSKSLGIVRPIRSKKGPVRHIDGKLEKENSSVNHFCE